MKVLVLGSGAREHALVRSLSADSSVDEVIAAPGNPGIESLALCLPLPQGLEDCDSVVDLATRHQVDLVVIGPEVPLVAGVADALRESNIAVFGPGAEAARLEGSKAFAKEIMSAAEVPTALARVCTTEEEVADALDALGAPHVVKDDGLAAGKGVVVTDDRAEALAHARTCLAKPGGRVVIEEFLDGPEVSLFCVCDGTSVIPLAAAQDFKRVGDGDTGPNTGGMGAYSPLDWAPADLTSFVVERIAQPTLDEMARRGAPFVGVLFVGLALTSRGPRVIEFNVRFGDPETQVVLARLRTPLGVLLYAAATGALADLDPLRWDPGYAVTVVIAAEGYPQAPRSGDPIAGAFEGDVAQGAGTLGDVNTTDVNTTVAANDAANVDKTASSYVLHAGTARAGDELVSAGGRVLSVVGRGATLDQARAQAYAAVANIDLKGSHHRSDIALAASKGDVTIPR